MPDSTETLTDWYVVRDGRTLRALEKRKLIEEPDALHRPKSGQWGRDYRYVEQAASVGDRLVLTTYQTLNVGVNGHPRLMKLQYFDGCFFPFVVEQK